MKEQMYLVETCAVIRRSYIVKTTAGRPNGKVQELLDKKKMNECFITEMLDERISGVDDISSKQVDKKLPGLTDAGKAVYITVVE